MILRIPCTSSTKLFFSKVTMTVFLFWKKKRSVLRILCFKTLVIVLLNVTQNDFTFIWMHVEMSYYLMIITGQLLSSESVVQNCISHTLSKSTELKSAFQLRIVSHSITVRTKSVYDLSVKVTFHLKVYSDMYIFRHA